jgi:hypothetical protein
LEVYLAAKASGDNSFYKVATVYVRHPIRKLKEISFTAEGAIAAKLGWEYVGEVGIDIQAMINNISIVSGVNIVLEDGMDSSLVPNQKANLKGYLFRDVLQEICGLFFGFATEDEDGNVLIKTFKSTSEIIELNDERMSSLPDIYDTVTVEGIQVKNSDVDYVYPSGTPTVNCVLNNALMTEEIFNTYVGNFVGLRYTPYNAEVGLGDFSLTPFNKVLINGKETIITEVIHNFDGGVWTSLSASSTSGESYTRTDTEMKSDIVYDKYPTAIQSTPSVPSVPSDPDVIEDEVIDTSVPAETGSIKVGCEAGIYKGYMCFVNIWGNFDKDMKPSSFNLPSCYVPAYPVTVTAFGRSNSFAGGNYISVGDNEYTAMQITILPEVDPENNNRVHIIASGSYLSPRDVYAWTDVIGDPLEKPEWENPDGRDLGEKSGFRFETFYILKDKYDDFINGRL